jgi:diaminopimelate epimerase
MLDQERKAAGMKLRFAKMNPTGNTTLFILDPVPVSEQAKVALALMDPSVLGGEQVGFVSLSTGGGPPGAGLVPGGPGPGVAALLRMMGGEFCGNAVRALGAYLAYKRSPGLSWAGDVARGLIQVSGATVPIEFEAQLDRNGLPGRAGCAFPGPFRVLFYRPSAVLEGALAYEPCSGAGSLPSTWLGVKPGSGRRSAAPEPEASAEAELTARVQNSESLAPGEPWRRHSVVAVVHMPGIVHMVLGADDYAPAEDALFRLRSAFRLEEEPCVGVMFCSSLGAGGGPGHKDGQGDVVVPLVHVPATGTTVWESSCASGAVAVALARAAARGSPGRFVSRQPGGTLHITIGWDARQSAQGTMVHLEGEVRVVAEGEVVV